MDSFDYDCLDGLNQFCNNENDLEQQIKKASKCVDIELSENDLEESSESNILDVKKRDEKKKLEFSNRPEGSKKNSHVNLVEIDLTNCDQPDFKRTEKPKNSDVICINFDESFDDNCASRIEKNSSTLFDTDSENIVIIILWKNNYEKIQHRKFQKFYDLMNIFAKRENCSVNDILFNIENKIISLDDTPHSINYKLYDIITGRVVPNCNRETAKKENKNSILLKIQSSSWKKLVEISIDKNENFSILCAKLAEELKINSKDFTLIFDGEPMDLTETPGDLDLEGGELIDCKIRCEKNVDDDSGTKKKIRQLRNRRKYK